MLTNTVTFIKTRTAEENPRELPGSGPGSTIVRDEFAYLFCLAAQSPRFGRQSSAALVKGFGRDCERTKPPDSHLL